MEGNVIDNAMNMLGDMYPPLKYYGLYTADELIEIVDPKPGLYIVYSLNSWETFTTRIGHWTSCHLIKTYNGDMKFEYYDPLAIQPYVLNENIDKFIARNFTLYTHCKYPVQSSESVACGYFVLSYCYLSTVKHLSLEEIMTYFSRYDYQANENFVRRLCYQIFYLL